MKKIPIKRTVRMKRAIEAVSGRVFDRNSLEISMKMCDGTRLWYVCRDRSELEIIFEFLKIEEELKEEYYGRYH